LPDIICSLSNRVEAAMHDDLIDRIYEAAALPDLWPSVLDKVTEVGDGDCTLLFTVTREDVRWTYSAKGGWCEDYAAKGWPAKTDRPFKLLQAQHAGFLGDLDVYTREELDNEPVYRDYLRPRGLGWGAATAIEVPCGNTLIVDVERRWESGPVDAATLARLDQLRPHLARAALISARLSLERARVASATLELLGLPAAVISDSLNLLAANPRLEALVPRVVQDRRDRVRLAQPSADALFQQALSEALTAAAAGAVHSIPIPAAGDEKPYIVHLVPIRRQARDVFARASAMMIVMPIGEQGVPSVAVIQSLFDLTAAEARVAAAVAQCREVSDIAAQSGVSKETVRTQVKSVLAKTGLRRQSELVALLSGKQLPMS
jgi:DNA-binding NarL/FixJ family response regulator